MKKINSKILLTLLLTFAMLLSMATVTAFAAGGTTVYLDPGNNWKSDDARFAVYYWAGDTDNGWVSMEDCGDGVYSATIPEGYTNIIFCRMDPATSENTWDNKWNQTVDLTITEDGDTFTVYDDWSGLGEWLSGTAIGGGNGGSNEGGAEMPTVDGVSTFTVAGVAGLCGVEWDPGYAANDMKYNATSGLYEKTFTGVPAGTYEFKVAGNHSWDKSWGDPNGVGQFGTDCQLTIDEEKDVTITFNPKTLEVAYVITASTGPSENAPAGALGQDTVVYVNDVAGWGEVYIYCWGGDNTMGWPGELMDYDADLGLYYYTVYEGTTGIIFNNGTGTQTKDIVVMPTDSNNYFENDDLQGDFVRNPNYVEPTPDKPAEPTELTWLQELALTLLLFLRSIEDFFKGLFA